MAKGIISAKPLTGATGTVPGKIVVTDGGGRTAADGSADSTIAASIPFGTEVPYTETSSCNVSDLVNFDVDTRGSASNITLLQAGKKISGEPKGDVTVNAGESVLVSAHLDGKITVSGGYLTILNKSHIEKDIVSTTDGSCVFITGTHVEGNVTVNGSSNFILKSSVIEKNISSDSNIYAGVSSNTIKGSLSVTNAQTCSCSGNKVSGSTNTPGCR